MPRKYIAEMVMDRISASRNYHPDTYTDAAPLECRERGKRNSEIYQTCISERKVEKL